VQPLSIITTSYNQRWTLELLLASLERQSTREFEVLVADDGSSDGTAELCRDYKGGFPLRFVTQPDLGYRKSRILNATIREARGEYLIFLDSDVIVERNFVEDHLGLRRPGAFVCGRRVELGPEFSKGITLGSVREGAFDRPGLSLVLSAMKKDTRSLKRALRVPSELARSLLRYDRELDILGSNLSLWKKDLVAVNGFNEALESYWGEDGDLFIRLRNSGNKPVSALGLCVQYHVFHPRRAPNLEMMRKYEELLGDRGYKWAVKGLSDG
jgi:glycosyltransferase involved in cell wall biosynthesis